MNYQEQQAAIAALSLPASVRAKSQFREFRADYTDRHGPGVIVARVRWDDQCGNGHNSLSVTATIYGPERCPGEETINHKNGRTLWSCGGGCCHEEIAKHLPELAHLIRWHLFDPSGPMHYVANTVYHALEHGPRYAWVHHKEIKVTPPGGGHSFTLRDSCLKYCDTAKAEAIVASNPAVYRLEPDPKSAKERNLDHARRSAAWPDATDEDLTAPGLEARLIGRLPALVDAMKRDIEALGFTY